jgi:hypothetical protein
VVLRDIPEERMMSKNTSQETHTAQEPVENKSDVFERISSSLDGWRVRIDELVVQLDLVNLDARDEVRKSVNVAQNVYLAAHSKLSDARADAALNLASLEKGLEQLLRDLGRVFEEAEAVVRRARES